MGAVHGRGMEYGTQYRKHQELLVKLKEQRQVTQDLERQVELSDMKLNKARRLLLEEAALA
ncbi:hypothetical protein D3C85_961980 [compost metagenome]